MMRTPGPGRIFSVLLFSSLTLMAPLHAQQSVHDVGSRIEAPGDAKPLPWKSVEQKMIFHKAGAMWFQFANPKTGGEKLTYTDASAFCKQYGLRLPTREEVQTTRAELEIADAKLMRYERDFWVSYQPEGEKYSQMQLATNFGLNLGYKYMAVDSGMYDKAPLGTLIRCVFDAASPTLPGEPWRSDLATDVPPSMK